MHKYYFLKNLFRNFFSNLTSTRHDGRIFFIIINQSSCLHHVHPFVRRLSTFFIVLLLIKHSYTQVATCARWNHNYCVFIYIWNGPCREHTNTELYTDISLLPVVYIVYSVYNILYIQHFSRWVGPFELLLSRLARKRPSTISKKRR